jgi:hypothetical protein
MSGHCERCGETICGCADAPSALTDGLDADAARYRWIRENISADLEWYLLGMHGMGADGLDNAIDAAITIAANAIINAPRSGRG